MRTSWSLNCSRMSSHRGVGGSSAMASFGVSIQVLRLFAIGSRPTILSMLLYQFADLRVSQTSGSIYSQGRQDLIYRSCIRVLHLWWRSRKEPCGMRKEDVCTARRVVKLLSLYEAGTVIDVRRVENGSAETARFDAFTRGRKKLKCCNQE